MGTGKTAVGKRLAKRLDWRFVDIDELIEASAKMPIARIFAERGEAVFRRLERRFISHAIHGSQQVVATGGGAVMDPQNRARLRASGPLICLTARPQVILERVGRKLAMRPLLAGLPAAPRKGLGRAACLSSRGPAYRPSGAGRRDRQAQAGSSDPLARIRTLLNRRAGAYAQADLTIDTSNLSVDEVVNRIWEKISPCLCKSWQYLLEHGGELSQRYGGKYIVVVENRIVGCGQTQLEAYQHARLVKSQDAGIYYIPLAEESLTAL